MSESLIKEELSVDIQTIDAALLSKMFLAGAKNLEAKKEWINELNVFPVPDGDTGTNMSMTIISAAKEVAAVEKPVMKDLAKAISSGSLRQSIDPGAFCEVGDDKIIQRHRKRHQEAR